MDKYVQFDLVLPTDKIFGFGERTREFGLTSGAWNMYSKKQDSLYDDGTGGLQGSGVHPFILYQTRNKSYAGIFFRNSAPTSPVLHPNGDGKMIVSYITTGGPLDVIFFLPGTVHEITSRYFNVIGRPAMPPVWAQGWHQASTGYDSLDKVKAMIAAYKTNGMPLDGVFLDNAYMDKFADFTVGTSFDGLLDYTKTMNSDGHHLILAVDAGIPTGDNDYYKYCTDN